MKRAIVFPSARCYFFFKRLVILQEKKHWNICLLEKKQKQVVSPSPAFKKPTQRNDTYSAELYDLTPRAPGRKESSLLVLTAQITVIPSLPVTIVLMIPSVCDNISVCKEKVLSTCANKLSALEVDLQVLKLKFLF